MDSVPNTIKSHWRLNNIISSEIYIPWQKGLYVSLVPKGGFQPKNIRLTLYIPTLDGNYIRQIVPQRRDPKRNPTRNIFRIRLKNTLFQDHLFPQRLVRCVTNATGCCIRRNKLSCEIT